MEKNGRILKPSKNKKGYCIVNLMIDGKRVGVAVHTLVAMAFCDGYKKGLQVNHKDGNKSNNNASNLEWCTNQYNVEHAFNVLNKNKRGENPNSKSVIAIDKRTLNEINRFDSLMNAADWLRANDVVDNLRIAQQSISRVLTGNRKTYKGYIWKYN